MYRFQFDMMKQKDKVVFFDNHHVREGKITKLTDDYAMVKVENSSLVPDTKIKGKAIQIVRFRKYY